MPTAHENDGMAFVEMLRGVRTALEMQQQDFAAGIKISPQYLHDLERGRRLPSVAVVEKICHYLSRGPKGRREWHRAGARAHGWSV